MNIKLLAEHHLELLSLKGGYTGLSGSTLTKMPHCWKSHFAAHKLYMIANPKEIGFLMKRAIWLYVSVICPVPEIRSMISKCCFTGGLIMA